MKNARRLRAELELWKLSWQQVETFLDQIDGAADEDGTQRRRLEGLLRLAGAVEHVRALDDPANALGDPVVDALPVRAWKPSDETTQPVPDAWAEDLRRWRLPGADEVELAVGLLHVDDDEAKDQVDLPGLRTVFQVRGADGTVTPLVLPSYPAGGGGSIVGPTRTPDIADAGRGSLFSKDERRDATLPPDGDGTDDSPVRSWTALTGARRGALPDSGALLSSFRSVDGPPWGGAPPASLAGVVAGISTVLATPQPSAAAVAGLGALATTALGSLGPLVDDVAAAKQASDDEGFADADLTAAIDAAVVAVVAPRDALLSIVAASTTLLGQPGSTTARADLVAARAALQQASALPAALVDQPVEDPASPLGRELDTVVRARVEYPDGTLRKLRTLETGFAGAWPAMRRWFVLRHGAALAPALRAFLDPFVTGLGALLRGGATGLPADGLSLGTDTPVGVEQVDLAQPGSMAGTLADVLEPGHLAVVGVERPAPLVVLGVTTRLGHVSLSTAPLRLSMAPPSAAPGPIGVVPAGSALGRVVPRGLSARELRRGRSDSGPGWDALVAEALGLFSRLALLVGTDGVERLLQGLGPSAPLTTRLVPTPALPGVLAGTVPANATSLVVHGLGPAWWAAPGQDGVPLDAEAAEPRLVRPGELLLLRGRVAGDGGAPGGLVQAPVEVDDVVAVSGRALARMETARAAVLSTDAAALPAPGDAGAPPLLCGPDEQLTLVLLKRSWARETLLADVRLTRTFRGFDAPSLAARRLLPLDLVTRVLGSAPPDEPGVGRGPELAAALDLLDAWTRYGR